MYTQDMDMPDATKALFTALLAARKQMPTVIAKDATADTGKFRYEYATLPSLLSAVTPVLLAHGLMITQEVEQDQHGNVAVRTHILHEQGGRLSYGSLAIPVAGNTAQAAGSAITYARRYALMAIFGMASDDEDDDGRSASDLGGRLREVARRAGEIAGVPAEALAAEDRALPKGRAIKARSDVPPAGVPVNQTDKPCPECHAPPGRMHATNCPLHEGGATRSATGSAPMSSHADDEDFYPPEFTDEVLSEYASLVHSNLDLSQSSLNFIEQLAQDDGASRKLMNPNAAPGKKISQYGLLASKIDEQLSKEHKEVGIDHKAVLSALLTRPVSKANPPGMGCKWLLDMLMEGNEEAQAVVLDVADACYLLQAGD